MEWYLKKASGETFGPVATAALRQWAAGGRIAPEDQVSTDQQTWMSAVDLPDLGLDWMVELGPDKVYGPFHLLALGDLIREGGIPAAAPIVHRVTGERHILHEALLLVVLEQNTRLAATAQDLRLALESAQAELDSIKLAPDWEPVTTASAAAESLPAPTAPRTIPPAPKAVPPSAPVVEVAAPHSTPVSVAAPPTLPVILPAAPVSASQPPALPPAAPAAAAKPIEAAPPVSAPVTPPAVPLPAAAATPVAVIVPVSEPPAPVALQATPAPAAAAPCSVPKVPEPVEKKPAATPVDVFESVSTPVTLPPTPELQSAPPPSKNAEWKEMASKRDHFEKELHRWKRLYADLQATSAKREQELSERVEHLRREELDARTQLEQTQISLQKLQKTIHQISDVTVFPTAAEATAAQRAAILDAYNELSHRCDTLMDQLNAKSAELEEFEQSQQHIKEEADQRVQTVEAHMRKERDDADRARKRALMLEEDHLQLLRSFRDLNDRYIRMRQGMGQVSTSESPWPPPSEAAPKAELPEL